MNKFKVQITDKKWNDMLSYLIESDKDYKDIARVYENCLPSFMEYIMRKRIWINPNNESIQTWLNIFQSIILEEPWKSNCLTKVKVTRYLWKYEEDEVWRAVWGTDESSDESSDKKTDPEISVMKEIVNLLEKLSNLKK